jgi:hypothetical protein
MYFKVLDFMSDINPLPITMQCQSPGNQRSDDYVFNMSAKLLAIVEFECAEY